MDAGDDPLEQAYAAGDHRRARALARSRLESGRETERARQVLRETEIDWFLPAIAALGLGLTAWLVYNYWL
jgi:hypothetical protein